MDLASDQDKILITSGPESALWVSILQQLKYVSGSILRQEVRSEHASQHPTVGTVVGVCI